MRDELGSSCELSCNPSICCIEPSGCHSLAAPRLQQSRCSSFWSPGQCQGAPCSMLEVHYHHSSCLIALGRGKNALCACLLLLPWESGSCDCYGGFGKINKEMTCVIGHKKRLSLGNLLYWYLVNAVESFCDCLL